MTLSRIPIGFLFLALLVFFPGCSFRTPNYGLQAVYIANVPHVNLNNSYRVQKALYQQYRQWRGTPYRYGGLSRNGIDCSGFVYLTFRTRFGIRLPRTTDGQIEMGYDVSARRLEPGDLLFFSTGFFDHHVGIYLGGKNFIHASEHHGVMISSLDNHYWRSNFKEARRIR